MAQEILLSRNQIDVDPAKNISRDGKPHDPAHIEWLADRFLDQGQLAPIEVTPLEGAADRYDLVFGYARCSAAELLQSEAWAARVAASEKWPGKLRAVVVPVTSAREREDRNIAENLGASLSPIDVALLARRFTSPPDEGGRGYSLHTASLYLKRQPAELRRLLKLTGLIEDFRAMVRLNHRNPHMGITIDQGQKLAKRSADEQREIFDKSKDAGGNVTPKSLRGEIAPHQGRQGQPIGATGAVLSRIAEKFAALEGDKTARERCGFKSTRELETAQGLIDLLTTGATERKIPDALRRLVTTAQERQPPPPKEGEKKSAPPRPEELQAQQLRLQGEKPA